VPFVDYFPGFPYLVHRFLTRVGGHYWLGYTDVLVVREINCGCEQMPGRLIVGANKCQPTNIVECFTHYVGDSNCHGTLQGRGRLKSHGLSETPIVWRNTSETFTPRGFKYNGYSCELVECFELKESDCELRRSCLRRQSVCLQPCARIITQRVSSK